MIVLILALWILTTYWLLTEPKEAPGRPRTEASPADPASDEGQATCPPAKSDAYTSPASSSPSSS